MKESQSPDEGMCIVCPNAFGCRLLEVHRNLRLSCCNDTIKGNQQYCSSIIRSVTVSPQMSSLLLFLGTGFNVCVIHSHYVHIGLALTEALSFKKYVQACKFGQMRGIEEKKKKKSHHPTCIKQLESQW